MSTTESPSTASPGANDGSTPQMMLARTGQAIRAILRAAVLATLYPFAVADAAWQRLVVTPSGTALAHSRAAWLHRWSRIVHRVLGLRLDQRGFTPVSGLIVASHATLVDAILLAAVRPCVFVAGTEVRRWPIVGLLARLGGTLFVDPRRRHDTARINFMIQRALQRRLPVVIFPECGGSNGTTLRVFTSALFQPAVELGCTLTAAAIKYDVERDHRDRTPAVRQRTHFCRPFAHLLASCHTHAVIAFHRPTFHQGDRKQLARRVRTEVLNLAGEATPVA